MTKRRADGTVIMESSVFQYEDRSYRTRLRTAIETEDKQLFLNALKSGASVRISDNNGWTPLHFASKLNRMEFMKIMVKKNQEVVNIKTHSGTSPLAICCEMNNYDTLCFLLSLKTIEVNCVDNEIATPLHIACNKGHFQIVKELINHGALVNAKDISGFTPLHEAVVKNNLEICQYLLSHGADPFIKDHDHGLYPVHFACQNGNLSIVNFLLDNMEGFSIDTTGVDGRTALMISIASKNVKLVEELLKRGADPNIADKNSIIALHIASRIACFEIFKIIYQQTSANTISTYCTINRGLTDEIDNNFTFPNSIPTYCILNRGFMVEFTNTFKAHSLIILAIEAKDFGFLQNLLNFGLNKNVLNCPHLVGNTLFSPISFLLNKDLNYFNCDTVKFLNLLIESGSPLTLTFKGCKFSVCEPLTACISSLDESTQPFAMECLKILLQKQPILDTLNKTGLIHFRSAVLAGCDIVLLLLQHTDVIEPADVIQCFLNFRYLFREEHPPSSLCTMCMLLKLIPKRSKYIAGYLENSTQFPACFYKTCIEVPSLAVSCRYAIRKQLHRVSQNKPLLFRQNLKNSLFRQNLKNLPLPPYLLDYMNYS